MRNDGTAILSLSSFSTGGWRVPPGSSITAGTAETVSAANKQPSQKWSLQKIHVKGCPGSQQTECVALRTLHSSTFVCFVFRSVNSSKWCPQIFKCFLFPWTARMYFSLLYAKPFYTSLLWDFHGKTAVLLLNALVDERRQIYCCTVPMSCWKAFHGAVEVCTSAHCSCRWHRCFVCFFTDIKVLELESVLNVQYINSTKGQFIGFICLSITNSITLK